MCSSPPSPLTSELFEDPGEGGSCSHNKHLVYVQTQEVPVKKVKYTFEGESNSRWKRESPSCLGFLIFRLYKVLFVLVAGATFLVPGEF